LDSLSGAVSQRFGLAQILRFSGDTATIPVDKIRIAHKFFVFLLIAIGQKSESVFCIAEKCG